MARPHINDTMLHMAEVIAFRTTCARRAVGCILVDKDNRILSAGHNGTPRGTAHCTDKPCKGAEFDTGQGLELCKAIHAEQNALMFCNDIMKIDKCFVTDSPCIHCIKMLMNTSCREIIFTRKYANAEQCREEWLKDLGRDWIHWDSGCRPGRRKNG